MKLINRGFITVHHKNAYWNWANQFNEEAISFTENDEIEPNVYLIEEDFMEEGPIIEQNFKKIFQAELMMVTDDEAQYPEKITLDLFNEWFVLEMGSTVIDIEKSDLKTEKI